MEKLLTKTKNMQKNTNTQQEYVIKIAQKENGYQARTTLRLGGVVASNPRPETFSINSAKEAVNKLVNKIQIILSTYTNLKIRLTRIEAPNCVYYTLEETEEKPEITFVATPKKDVIKKVYPIEMLGQPHNNKSVSVKPDLPEDKECYSIDDAANYWYNDLINRTEKNVDEENRLSMKTAESYIYNLKTNILPFFKNAVKKYTEYFKIAKLLSDEDKQQIEEIKELVDCANDITKVEEKHIRSLLESVKGKTNRKNTLTILKIFFGFLKEKKIVKYNPAREIRLARQRTKTKEIDFIGESRREYWINCMIKENSDISLLFLSMLLIGARPEEACGFKWTAFDFDNDDVSIENAYKDFPIYNEFMEVIGHKRCDDILKTPESYRHIHLDPILKNVLLRHKSKQQATFKRLHKKWTESEYLFLNNTYQPFVSDTLSRNMPRFISRHDLEHMTVYGLRHSFATHCKELGMDREVLAKLMGHTDYSTTQKYYIHISTERKIAELKQIQEKERKTIKLLKTEDLSELESYNEVNFEQMNEKGVEIDENDKIKSTFLSALA